jgi:uncharacterized protein YqeY
MSLKEKINEDMKTAMKARETERLAAIRLLMAAMKQKEVDERAEMTDTLILSIIDKMVKQRKDSIEQYKAGNRADLVAKEEFELSVLAHYMPKQLTAEEVGAIIDAVIAETGAAGAKDMGKVMNALRPKVAGRADMGALSGLVKAKLG